MKTEKQQCPEIPFFGASYPDGCCIDGYMWDMDWFVDGMLIKGGEDPCPFCNREEYVKHLKDGEYTNQEIENYLQYLDTKYGWEEPAK